MHYELSVNYLQMYIIKSKWQTNCKKKVFSLHILGWFVQESVDFLSNYLHTSIKIRSFASDFINLIEIRNYFLTN